MQDKVTEMIKLREQGLSFREIGEKYGCTKQRVCQLIGTISRKCSVDLEKIRYKGFYELFKNDTKITFLRLARIMHGNTAKYSDVHATEEKIRRFLYGETEASAFRITQINNLLEYTGKTYEEMFKPRKGGER